MCTTFYLEKYLAASVHKNLIICTKLFYVGPHVYLTLRRENSKP